MPNVPLSHRCDRTWSELSGDGPARHCDRCDRAVHDLDAMAPDARAALIGGREPACVRFLAVGLLAGLLQAPALAGDPEAVVPGEGPLPELAPPQEVLGVLDRSGIERAIRERISELKEAYQRRLKREPHLAGTVSVRFSVEGGVVTEAHVLRSSLGDPTFEQSVLDYVRSLTFPHDARMEISYPFAFAP